LALQRVGGGQHVLDGGEFRGLGGLDEIERAGAAFAVLGDEPVQDAGAVVETRHLPQHRVGHPRAEFFGF
jgi:hypothetical protein